MNRSLSLWIAVVLCGAVSAQEPVATTLPEVAVVGSKERASILPGSADYITHEEMMRNNSSDVHEILRQVPGVYIREEEGFGNRANISIRGVSIGRSEKVTLMEDGVLTAPAPYSNPSAYYSPTVGRMAGIEVLKGSSQIQYGPHTTGGVINYISTRIPLERTLYDRLTVGSDGEFRNHSYYGNTHQTPIGNLGYVIEHFRRHNDGFKEIDRTTDFHHTDQTGFDISDYMFKFAWEPNTSRYQRWEAKAGYTDQESDESYLGLTDADFQQNPFRRYSASRFDKLVSQHYRTYLRHYWEIGDKWNLVTTGYYNYFHRDWFKLRQVNGRDISRVLADGNGLNTMRGQAAGTLGYRHGNRYYYLGGVESILSHLFDWGTTRHKLDFGVRYHTDRIRQFESDVTYHQTTSGSVDTAVYGTTGDATNRREYTDALAFHLRDEISYGNWTFTPGLRYETLEYEWIEDRTGAAPRTKDLDALAGGMGVNYALNPRVSIFGGIHSGFSFPSPQSAINNGIENEKSVGYELGLRYDDRRGGIFELTGFYTDLRDLIVPNNVGGGGAATTENAGDIDVAGAELKAGYTWRVGMRGYRIPTLLTATYTNAELDGNSNSTDASSIFAGGRDGAKVPYIPEVQVRLATGIENDRWGLTFTGLYVDDVFTTAANRSDQVGPTGNADARVGKTDDQLTLDIGTWYNFGENRKFFANFQNVTDEEYMVSRHPEGPRPGRPFSAEAGVEVKF